MLVISLFWPSPIQGRALFTVSVKPDKTNPPSANKSFLVPLHPPKTALKRSDYALRSPTKLRLFALLTLLGMSVSNPNAQSVIAPSTNVYLPLVSVGDRVRWFNTSDDFRVVVGNGSSKNTKLEVFSPGLNLNDYTKRRGGSDYIGDERYDQNVFFTRFKLLDSKRSVVSEKTFSTTTANTWFTLLDRPLNPGAYPFDVRSHGNGKNAFGLIATGDVRLEATQFTVNAHGKPGKEMVAANIPVPGSLMGQRVRISSYDGDGLNELVLYVRFPGGRLQRLTTSEDVSWASNDIKVTKDLVGKWQLVARIGLHPKQFSNSFTLRFQAISKQATPLYAQLPVTAPQNPTKTPLPPTPATPPPATPQQVQTLAPLEVTIVDAAGQPVPGATYSVTGESERRVQLKLNQGYVRLSTEITVGDGILEDAGNTVLVGVSGASIRFTVHQTQANITVQAVAEIGTRRVQLEGVPVTLNGETKPSGSSFTVQPGEWTITPTPLPGSSTEAVNLKISDDATQTITIVYHVEAGLILRADRSSLSVGDALELTATASTAFPYPVPVRLSLGLPGEVQSSATKTLEASIQANQPVTFTLPAEAITPTPSATVVATLEPFNLNQTVQLEIKAPPTATSNPPAPTPTQADLEITHSADQNPIEIGQTATYTINLANLGPIEADHAHIRFPKVEGATLESWSASQGTCTVTDAALECDVNRLESGATALVLVILKPLNVGPLNTTVTATSATPDPNAGNNQDTFTLVVNAPPLPPAHLLLTREAVTPNPALPGETVTVRMTLENNGGMATNFILTDDPSALLSANITRFEGRLEPGEVRDVTYTARVEPGAAGTGTLHAEVTAPDLEPVVAETPFERVNIGLSKTASLTVSPRPGTPIPFVITVTNPVNRAIKLELQGDAPGLHLEPDESGTLELAPLETKTIRVTGTAGEAGAFTNTVKATLFGVQTAASASASVKVIELPSRERESSVTLRVRVAQTPQGDVIVSDILPPGATYTPGSSQLNGQPLPDPLMANDRLFWILPPGTDGDHAITYSLTHTAALETPEDRIGVLLRLPSGTNREPSYRVLTGNPDLIAAFKQAQQPANTAPSRQRVGALIVNPVSGTLFRDRDQVNITVDVPLHAENIQLSVNGEIILDAKIGTKTFDEGTGRTTFEYIAVKLKPGRNQLTLTATENGQALEDRAQVLVSGSPVSIRIEAANPITNDANDRPALKITVLDANNLPAQDSTLTLESSPEPAVTDANPNEPGLQVRYTNGVVIVPLSNIGTRTVVKAEARIGPVRGVAEFPVLASPRPPIAAGALSLELRAGSGFSVAGSLQGFVRATLWDTYLLTVGINQQASYGTEFSANGDLLPPSNESSRFPLLGDTAVRGSDTTSSDGFYARLENGASFVQYGQFGAGFTGRLSSFSTRMNGVQGLYRQDNLSLTAFGAFAPRTNLTNISPTNPYGFAGDGTGLYKLSNAPIQPGSERVRIVVRDQNGLSALREQELERLKDYAIDNLAGIITLSRPLQPTDENSNPQFLVIEYASESTDVPLEFRFGTQARIELGNWMIQATALKYSASKPLLAAVGASYAAEGFKAETELGYAGDWALSSSVNLKTGGLEANLAYQNLGVNYTGPSAALSNGADLSLSASYNLTQSLKFSANLALGQRYATGETREEYGLQAANDFGPFSLSLGLRGLAASSRNAQGVLTWNTDVYVTGGVKVPLGPVTLGLEQRVPISSGTPGQTAFSLEYALTESVKIELKDTFSYDGTNQGSVGVRGTFGTTNISAGYDLPTTSGGSARGRVGIDTTVPLGSGFSAQLGGSLEAPLGQALSASLNLGLGYAYEQTRANATAQFSITPNGFKQVYSLGAVIQPSSSPLVLSPKLEITNGPEGSGLKFSTAGAYRGSSFSLLTNHQIRTGIYAPNGDALEGEVQAVNAFSSSFSLRGGLAYKLSSGVFTGQLNAGVTYWTSNTFGIGSSAVWAFQPGYGFRATWGIEGSLRVTDGLVLTGGFNLLGFDGGIGSITTAPGFYLRLDFVFDENTFGLNGSSAASTPVSSTPVPSEPQAPSPTK